ncbi:hypothetical protein CSB09_03145 [Candidatus Gracilibacteria bacterium]|nr:MAG: hypothetical protein CSB09_03145 [Candidatus Gracilibacteria bacterium]
MSFDKKINTVLLNTTGAIGDAVQLGTLLTAMKSENPDLKIGVISNPLTHGVILKDGVFCFSSEDEISPKFKSAPSIDLRDYLQVNPHGNPRKHSSELLVEYVSKKLKKEQPQLFESLKGMNSKASKDNIKISLSQEEKAFGERVMGRIRKQYPGKKIIVLSAYSTTLNRDIPQNTMAELIKKLSQANIIPILQEPLPKNKKPNGCILASNFYDEQEIQKEHLDPLRSSVAIWIQSDGFVGVDSGPHHLINAGIQGLEEQNESIKGLAKEKVLTILGSSAAVAVKYDGNRVIQADLSKSCQKKAPCGFHGYEGQEGKKKEGQKNEFPIYFRNQETISEESLSKKGFSKKKIETPLCVLPHKGNCEVTKCMHSISYDIIANEIIEMVYG